MVASNTDQSLGSVLDQVGPNIIHHVSNSDISHPIIHFPKIFGTVCWWPAYAQYFGGNEINNFPPGLRSEYIFLRANSNDSSFLGYPAIS